MHNYEDFNKLPSNIYYDHAKHSPNPPSTSPGSSDATSTKVAVAAVVGGGITWQEMFQQLKDFHELKHHRVPPRLARWMNAQRRQYKMYEIGLNQPTGIITNRIRQLNSIGFDWHAVVSNDGVEPPLPPPPPLTRSSNLRPAAHPTMTKTNWSEQEDETILRLQMQWGNKWRKISSELNTGRTENGVKNRWMSLDRSRRRRLEGESTDDEAGQGVEMDVERFDGEAVPQDEDDNADNSDNDVEQDDEDIEIDDDVQEFIVGQDRTDHVQRLVRDALEREKRPRGALKSRASTPKKTSGRIRKPSRRVQESHLTFGSNNSSCNNSEGGDSTMQLDALDSKHEYSYHRPSNPIQGSHRSEAVDTSKKEQFPETLFRMVNTCSESEPHIIEWVLDGTAFQVKDVNLLPAVLYRYFRHKNYVSLNRMLHLYGFKRHTTGKQFVDEFHHPHFTRWSSRDSLVAFVTKCNEAPKYGQEPRNTHRPSDNTAPLKGSSKVQFGEGCGKGFSTDLLMTNFSRHHALTEGDAYTVTQNDVIMSLRSREYKRVMFAQFKKLGSKDGIDDVTKVRRLLSMKHYNTIKLMSSSNLTFFDLSAEGGWRRDPGYI